MNCPVCKNPCDEPGQLFCRVCGTNLQSPPAHTVIDDDARSTVPAQVAPRPEPARAPSRPINRTDEQVKDVLRSKTFKVFASVAGCIGFTFLCLASCPFVLALLGLGGIWAWTNP